MFGAIAGGIASALAGGAMSKLFGGGQKAASGGIRSEERFSRNAETDLVCRLLLEKKKDDENFDTKTPPPVHEASSDTTPAGYAVLGTIYSFPEFATTIKI